MNEIEQKRGKWVENVMKSLSPDTMKIKNEKYNTREEDLIDEGNGG